ncbi:MAG: serine/threonine-protein kinase [Microthrixaceae bacterium]
MSSIAGIELRGLRGSGGFADVHVADEPALSRQVAVKLFRVRVGSQERRSFEREATAMGRLSGIRNVVQIHRSGVTDDGHPYLVMQLMDGSLEDLLAEGPVPARDVCRAGVLLGTALLAAHAEGILHRDIKPANVLIDRYGEPALSDFGIASLSDSAGNSFLYAFTADHAAPEVFDHTVPSPAADVYSLASTLWTAMEGCAPYERLEDEGALTFMRRVQDSPSPSSPAAAAVDPGLDELLRRAMAKDPAERPSLEELVAGLGGYASALEHTTGGAPLVVPARPHSGRATSGAPTADPHPHPHPGPGSSGSGSSSRPRTLRLALVGVLLVLLGGLVVWGATRDRDDSAAPGAERAAANGPTTTDESTTDGGAADPSATTATTSAPSHDSRRDGVSDVRPADDTGLSDTSGVLRSRIEDFAASTDQSLVRNSVTTQAVSADKLGFGSLPSRVDYAATNAANTTECLRILVDDLVIVGAAGSLWFDGQRALGLNAVEFETELQARQYAWSTELFFGIGDKHCSGWPADRVAVDPTDLVVDRRDFSLDAPGTSWVAAIDDEPNMAGFDGGILYQVTVQVDTTVLVASVSSISDGLAPAEAGAILHAAIAPFLPAA